MRGQGAGGRERGAGEGYGYFLGLCSKCETCHQLNIQINYYFELQPLVVEFMSTVIFPVLSLRL